MCEGTWAKNELVTSAEGLRVKAHGNVDVIKYGAEGQNVKALDSGKFVKQDVFFWHLYV